MPAIVDKLIALLDRLSGRSHLLTRTFLVIGGLWSAQQAYKLLGYANLYFLPRQSLRKYVTVSSDEKETWALVTGSSDGIGKGFAEELCSRGINVVLHGRNELKLQGVQNDLQARWPSRQIKLLVLEASAGASDLTKIEGACKSLQDLNLRILINNIAGHGTAKLLWAPLIDRSSSDVSSFIDVNALFPTEITRVLLPLLMKNQPALIINIGSGVSDFPCPYVDLLSGVKAYTQAWSRSLHIEMQAEKQDIEVLHFQVGMVQTKSAPRPTSFLVPSSRQFAKSALDVVGRGRDVVWPYWPHALQFGLIGQLPTWLRNRAIVQIALKEKEEEQARLEAKPS